MYYSVQRTPTPAPKIEICEIKDDSNVNNDTGSKHLTGSVSKGIPNIDDSRPSSLFSKASLLSNHRIDGNIEHDLSPLELIATVANDLSSYQEGRGLKRKPEDAALFENDEENSNSKEIQIQKSIEHAIDICSSNSNQGNKEATENITSSQETTKTKNNSRTSSPAVSSEIALKSTSKQKCLKSIPNLFDNFVSKLPATKEKPKTTDTASQCEPRPKKQKVSDSTTNSSQHSKSPVKVSKNSSQLQTVPQQTQIHQNMLKQQQQQQKQAEAVANHVTEKSKSQDDLQRQEKSKVNVNFNNNVELNGAITKGVEAKIKVPVSGTVSVTQSFPKLGNTEHVPTVSSMNTQKTSVIKTNSDTVKAVGIASTAQTNGFSNVVNVNSDKQAIVMKTKQMEGKD